MKKIRYILIVTVGLLVLQMSIHFIFKLSPAEVNLANNYLISKKYRNFEYDVSFINQLKSNSYSKETLSALNILASQDYNFYGARKIIKIINLSNTNLTQSGINAALEEINKEIGLIGNIIGYSLSFFKWLLFVITIELIKIGKGKLKK